MVGCSIYQKPLENLNSDIDSKKKSAMRSGYVRDNILEATLLKPPANLKVAVWLHFRFKKKEGS